MITFLISNFHYIESAFAASGLLGWLLTILNRQPANKYLSLGMQVLNFLAANILKAKNKDD